MQKKLIPILILLFTITVNAYPQGLLFSGSNVPISERSSYLVLGNSTPSFNDSLRISYKFMVFPSDCYGNIMRVSVNNTVYCLTSQSQDNNYVVDVNKEGYASFLNVCPGSLETISYKWIDVSLLFRLDDSSIRIDFGPVNQTITDIDLLSGDDVRIVFGKDDYVISIPTFVIKDLHIDFDKDNKYYFPMSDSDCDSPNEYNHKVKGSVDNPTWLAIDNWHWRPVYQFSEQNRSSTSYNPADKSIYSISNDSVNVVNYIEAIGGRLSTNSIKTRCPVNLNFAMSIPDSLRYSLLVYNFKRWNEDDSTTVALYDIQSERWCSLSSDYIQSFLHKPSFSYFYNGNGFLLFGGLSVDEFTNSLYFYSFDDQRLKKDSTYIASSISPRYFSSMGIGKDSNTCYIYGGIGNETGKQISGKLFYYDCYKVDLSDKTVSKLWETEWEDEKMVPIQNLLVKDNFFYTFCYQTYLSNSVLQLYEFNLSDGSHRKLGDGIPIVSEKRDAHAELYFDDTLKHLIAVVYDTSDTKTFNTSVYALNWPPVSVEQMARRKKVKHILIVIVSLLFIVIVAYSLRRWRALRRKVALTEYESEQNRIKAASSLRTNSIYLFGNFTVIDSNGTDISPRFSPKLRDILILIIERTIYSDGISSVSLSSLAWPEFMWENSKNIRNVTINNLRKALSSVHGFRIVFEDERYKAQIDDSAFCDFVEFAKHFKNISRENIDLLIGILNRGAFLKDVSTALSDDIKSNTENDVVTLLETHMPEYFQAGQYARSIYMSKDLLAIDPVHEKAIAILVKSYKTLKRNTEAVQAYQEFVKEYRRTYNEKYAVAFKNM